VEKRRHASLRGYRQVSMESVSATRLAQGTGAPDKALEDSSHELPKTGAMIRRG